MNEQDATVIALFSMCIDLATTVEDLVRWGREHAAVIGAQADHVIQTTRALFAARRAELQQGSV